LTSGVAARTIQAFGASASAIVVAIVPYPTAHIPEALMVDEATFVRGLLANPRDDDLRLVYADWLEEQGDPVSAAKAEFLRLTVQRPPQSRPRGWKKSRGRRLQQLAAGLDTDWLAVVSHLAIESCEGKRQAEMSAGGMILLRFDYLCDRHWQDMQPTADQGVRFCEGCGHQVHYCDTILDAREHAQQRHCIAVDLGIIRRDGDLEPEQMWAGWPSPEMIAREKERVKPDPVSAERALRKRQSNGGEPAELETGS
jgi:uncharacterized protein (TIGR02996 family)